MTLFVLWLIACRKDDKVDDGYAPGEAPIAKHLFDAARDEVDQQLNLQTSLNGFTNNTESKPRGGCATVSIAPTGNVFPKIVTIVFPSGCKTFAGADIEGTVAITISGRVREIGSIATFTLNGLKYKNYALSGNYVVTFLGPNAHKTMISNGQVVTPEGKIITYTASNSAMQTGGTNTTFKTNPATFLQDDVYEIMSTSSGINSRGHNFTLTTEKPIVYSVACQWIISGKITITEDSRPNITTALDYGDGSCDNKAELFINNVSTIINLP
ncbi:MAG: hypothetical protein IPO92_07935 [Saprospiraceae bacterium]|nr:hypothetical protein [Saprospiraceae bacterium]